jgi:hypothetical protein
LTPALFQLVAVVFQSPLPAVMDSPSPEAVSQVKVAALAAMDVHV